MAIFKKLTASVNSDEALMAEAANNHLEAYEILYNRYKASIYSFIFAMVKQGSIAEELTQETFLKVYRFRLKFENSYKFKTWLFTIAKNTTYDYFRKKKDLLLDDLKSSHDDEDINKSDLIKDESLELDEVLIEKNNKEVIHETLMSLSERYREILSLWMSKELSIDEISKVLNLTPSATKSLLFRSKEKFIKLLKGRNHDF